MQKEWLYGTYWKFRLISRANTWFTAGINDGFYNSYMLSTGPCMKEVLSVPLFATRGIKQAFVMKHKTIWFEIWRGCKVSTYDSIVVAARFFYFRFKMGSIPSEHAASDSAAVPVPCSWWAPLPLLEEAEEPNGCASARRSKVVEAGLVCLAVAHMALPALIVLTNIAG